MHGTQLSVKVIQSSFCHQQIDQFIQVDFHLWIGLPVRPDGPQLEQAINRNDAASLGISVPARSSYGAQHCSGGGCCPSDCR